VIPFPNSFDIQTLALVGVNSNSEFHPPISTSKRSVRVSVAQMIPIAYSNHLPEGFSILMVEGGCGKLYQGMPALLNSLPSHELYSETPCTSCKINGGMGA